MDLIITRYMGAMTQNSKKTSSAHQNNVIFMLVVASLVVGWTVGDRGDYLGCYKFNIDETLNTHTGQSADVCLSACEPLYYRYALLANGSVCLCGNTPGYFQLPSAACDSSCPKNDSQRCGGHDPAHASVYDTEVTAPGPPGDLRVQHSAERSVRVSWDAPTAHSGITGYMLRARVLHTFADTALAPLDWSVANNTLIAELSTLHPGSKYRISVAAVNADETGPTVTVDAETLIDTPEPSPPNVQIRERHGDKMVIHIPPARNVNGPVSRYRIVVSIELYQQGYIPENLQNHSMATAQGLPYYITAEIDPEDIRNDFIIGDGHIYNGFYNAPLPLTNDIEISLGVVSEMNHLWKIRYADSSKRVILNINEPEVVSPLIVGLGAAIAIGVVLLLIGVGALIVLHKRIRHVRLQRGSQSLPLSLSEPCIEIENAGFLQDEDAKVDHYAELKRKLWNVPGEAMDVDMACAVGVGAYGKFHRGRVGEVAALVLPVADRQLERSERRRMLRDLDSLLRTTGHDNVLALLGICETPTTLFVLLQDTQRNLKEALLQSRCDQGEQFSSLSEDTVLRWCTEVARGMAHLHARGLHHQRLSCRNVALSAGAGAEVACVAGFGLSLMRPLHETPDYSRWSAPETLRGVQFRTQADVWSFGCLVWEALTLGATPLAAVPAGELVVRLQRGVRPPQPGHVADELYQLCLQCWQLDAEERPAFPALLEELAALVSRPAHAACLSFTHYQTFRHDPYVPELEVIA